MCALLVGGSGAILLLGLVEWITAAFIGLHVVTVEMVLLLGVLFVSVIFGCIVLYEAYWRDVKRSFKKTKVAIFGEPKVEVVKEPSLFMSYLKAIHNKVCPQITIVDKKA
jgi:hypothetical protein